MCGCSEVCESREQAGLWAHCRLQSSWHLRLPVESGRVDHEATAAEHQIPPRRDGAVDSDRVRAMIQLRIEPEAAVLPPLILNGV